MSMAFAAGARGSPDWGGESTAPSVGRCAARWGAIDRVAITDDVEAHTIGEAAAIGICGSGTIDALAGMLDAGILDHTGLLQVDKRDQLPSRLRERLVPRGDERQFILLRAGEAGATAEIVLAQGI